MTILNLKGPSTSPSSSSLGGMPDDVLHEIVKHVAALTRHESKRIQKMRFMNLIRQGDLGKTKSLWKYEQSDPPILNSLQALSAVNRQMNQFCCPILWKALRFPSPLPVPMPVWNGLIDKYGPNVKSLTISLSKDWLGAPETPAEKMMKVKKKPSRLSERDNLLTRDEEHSGYWSADSHEGISRENVFRLVSQSSNLTSLRLIYSHPLSGGLDTPPGLNTISISRFQSNLSSLVGLAGALRHLDIQGHCTTLPACIISNTINLLPNLESLSCTGISSDASADDARNFPIALSELKHLTRLAFKAVEVVDISFIEHYPTALSISDLTIKLCDKLLVSQTPSLINTWTPHLTHLTLQTSSCMGPSEFLEDVYSFNPDNHQFLLPFLTHLTLSRDPNFDYLRCFQRCQNLRRLAYQGVEEDSRPTLLAFVASTFPRLEILSLDEKQYLREQAHDDQEGGSGLGTFVPV